MAFHVRNISAHNALRAGAIGGGATSREFRVTLVPYEKKYQRPAVSRSRVMSFPNNITFGDFKRRCTERLSTNITRIFTMSGGEIENSADIKDEEHLVCTDGSRYYSAVQRKERLVNSINSVNGQTQENHASRSKHVLRRFQKVVWKAKSSDAFNGKPALARRLLSTASSSSNEAMVGGDERSSIDAVTQIVDVDDGKNIRHERQRRRSTAASTLLNDGLADDNDRRTPKSPVKGCISRIKRDNLLSNGWNTVVSPDSPVRSFWDGVLGLLVVYYTIIVPVRISFDNAAPTEAETLADFCFTCVFILDIILNFRTAVKIGGVVIDDVKKIRNEYIKSWFFIDLLSSIPIDALFLMGGLSDDEGGMGNINKLLRLLRIFKLLRMLRLTRILARWERYGKIDPSLFRLAKLIGILVSTWHMLACCYWYVAMNADKGESFGHQWVPPVEIASSQFLSLQYAHAFFWAVVVTSGIGWDIHPGTPTQVYFTTVAIVTGLLMYAIIIGSASTLLSNLDVVQQERKRKLDEIKAYLSHRKVGKQLREEIFEFYEYLFSCNVNSFKESNVLSELPPSLQIKLSVAVNRQVVNSVPLFHDCSEDVLASVIEQLYQIVMLPGEYACEQGDAGEEMYFIVRGRVQIIYECEKGIRKELAIRKDGDFFGETALINNQVRSASAKALTYCDMLVLSRSGFDYIKEQHEGVFNTVEQASSRRETIVEKLARSNMESSIVANDGLEGSGKLLRTWEKSSRVLPEEGGNKEEEEEQEVGHICSSSSKVSSCAILPV